MPAAGRPRAGRTEDDLQRAVEHAGAPASYLRRAQLRRRPSLRGDAFEHVADRLQTRHEEVVEPCHLEPRARDELVDPTVEVATAGYPPLHRGKPVLPAGHSRVRRSTMLHEV